MNPNEQRRPLGEGAVIDDRIYVPDSTVITWPDEAVAILTARWLDLGGRDLALTVARGEICNRCARKALTSLGLAGGIGPATIARHLRDGYGYGPPWLVRSEYREPPSTTLFERAKSRA